MLTFEDFLKTDKATKDKGYHISSKGKLFYYNGLNKNYDIDKVFMCKKCIDITNIYFEQGLSNGIELLVDFQSPDQKIYDGIYITLSYTKKLTCDWKNFSDIVSPFITDKYQSKVLNLYKIYFKTCILNFIEHNKIFLARCGWLNDCGNRVFLSVNWGEKFYPEIRDALFNGAFNIDYLKKDIQEVSKTDTFHKLVSLLLSDTCIFTSFVYSIHSILWDYLYYYKYRDFDDINNDSTIFSLCLHGKSVATSKIIANLLLNFFAIPKKTWKIINGTGHISATSCSGKSFDNLFLYNSVPIIVTSKSNHFTKSTSIIKKIQRRREQSRLHIYPVYISDFPVFADEIVNICSDSAVEILNQIDSSELYHIHLNICFILFSFIQYLTKISNPESHPNRNPDYYMHSNIQSIIKGKNLSPEWIDNHTPELLLYSSIDNFCYYLNQTFLTDYVSEIMDFADTCFLSPEENHSPVSSDTKVNYLNLFCLFVQNQASSSRNKSWIWEGQESRGNKESCYYIASITGYEKFNKYLIRNSLPVISKSKITKLLKENQILKMPDTKSSLAVKRKNIYVHILIKDRLSIFCNQQ